MKTLTEAWDWYQATRRSLANFQRLARNHWENPSLEGSSIWTDDVFKFMESNEIVAQTERSLDPIDDLAVVVLFSVFESIVREFLVERIGPLAEEISEPILREAADDAVRGIEEGSFRRRVLEPLKVQGIIPPELITQIDQIRDYRNWVAHGRREKPINNVQPEVAYDRLGCFLERLCIPVGDEYPSAD